MALSATEALEAYQITPMVTGNAIDFRRVKRLVNYLANGKVIQINQDDLISLDDYIKSLLHAIVVLENDVEDLYDIKDALVEDILRLEKQQKTLHKEMV